MNEANRGALVFGMADGLTLVLGLILGEIIAHQPAVAIWHAALGGGLAEFGGMALGQYWSDPERRKLPALLNGAGCAFATLLSGSPFALSGSILAIGTSLLIIFLLAVTICFLREEAGLTGIIRTFGLLLAAGLLSGLSGLI